jgi:hypothetical protein
MRLKVSKRKKTRINDGTNDCGKVGMVLPESSIPVPLSPVVMRSLLTPRLVARGCGRLGVAVPAGPQVSSRRPHRHAGEEINEALSYKLQVPLLRLEVTRPIYITQKPNK